MMRAAEHGNEDTRCLQGITPAPERLVMRLPLRLLLDSDSELVADAHGNGFRVLDLRRGNAEVNGRLAHVLGEFDCH